MSIVTLPDRILRQVSKEVTLPLSEEDKNIAKEMIDYIKASINPDSNLRPGIGIAAVQLGYLKRMLYIYLPEMGPNNETFEWFLINPVVISTSEEGAALSNGEGCLSVPEEIEKLHDGLVHRKNTIKFEAYSYLEDQFIELELSGFLAIVFQHELDHLNGKLFIDRVDLEKPFEKLENEVVI